MGYVPEHASVSLDDVVAALGFDVPATHLNVSGISHDNREIQPDWIFAAIQGEKVHGIEFAEQAIAQGAVAILTDSAGHEKFHSETVPVIVSADPRKDMAQFARLISHDVQAHLRTIGITGTNGKTTTSFFIEACLQAVEAHPLLIGTTGITFEKSYLPSARTTPESTQLHRIFSEAFGKGARSVVMEVSSHALNLHRVAGVHFDVAVFTGLSPDHLDFHPTMDDYFAAKAKLFTPEYAQSAVICIDTEWGQKLASRCEIPFVTYGDNADWQAINVRPSVAGSTFTVVSPHKNFEVEISLPGSFNVKNALASLAAMDVLGYGTENCASMLRNVVVPGRMEPITNSLEITVLVDYAHTPDAVEKALRVARENSSARVITIIGCGGNRDSSKREPMGRIAAELSDIVLVTDDNPRNEDPAFIRAAVLRGASAAQRGAELQEVADRKSAIKKAIETAKPGDVVMILGKGHEQGQDVAGVMHPFDDREVAREAVAHS